MSKFADALEYLDLEAWLEQYDDVKDAGSGEIRLRNCPKCGNDKYKIYVNVEKKLWNCHRCDWGRHIRDVCQLMAYVSDRNINDVRKEVLKTVAPAASDSVFMNKLHDAFEDEEDEEEDDLEEIILPGSQITGDDGIMAKRVRQYAYRRGLGDADIARYGLRYSVRLRSYSGAFLVFPVYRRKTVVAWQGRSLAADAPKYVSYDDIANWLWPLSMEYHSYITRMKSAVLVEGVFDAVGMHSVGHHHALCTFGKKISKNQIALLQRLGVKDVTLAWDPEASRAIERAAVLLRGMFPSVFIVDLTSVGGLSSDPGDVIMDKSLSRPLLNAMENRINVESQDFYQWRLNRALS